MTWIVLWLKDGEWLSPTNHNEKKRSNVEENVHDIVMKKGRIDWFYDQT